MRNKNTKHCAKENRCERRKMTTCVAQSHASEADSLLESLFSIQYASTGQQPAFAAQNRNIRSCSRQLQEHVSVFPSKSTKNKMINREKPSSYSDAYVQTSTYGFGNAIHCGRFNAVQIWPNPGKIRLKRPKDIRAARERARLASRRLRVSLRPADLRAPYVALRAREGGWMFTRLVTTFCEKAN